jgi:RNA polymerase sigma-70 factor (ECF subfamily)
MPSDEELIGAVAGGDEQALETLCGRYQRPLYGFIARHTGGRDVDDLYQETWLRVVRAAARFDRTRRFSTWLFQIAVNLCRDWHRRPPLEAAEPSEGERRVGTHDPGARVEARLDAERLLACLPEPQRSVVILRYYQGFGEAETAEILGCPEGTVKSRLHNALARMLAAAGKGAE